MFSKETVKNLPNNNRFYVLACSFFISILVTCLLRLQVGGEQAYYVQLKQVFGFLSVGLLYVTLIISPVQMLIGTPEWMKNVIFARRGLGVSAMYFAVLHGIVSFWGELGGFAGMALLPGTFVWPLIASGAALLLLCVLAAMSLDAVVVRIGYHRWKWGQRLVYLCGVLIIVHVWSIGVHFVPGTIQTVCLGALVLLFGLEAWRIAVLVAQRYHLPARLRPALFMILWTASTVLLCVFAFSRTADGHSLIKDSIAGKGGVLHITPDDDPIAGEPTLFRLETQVSFAAGQSAATFTVTDDQGGETTVPARVQGSALTVDYMFPRQGLYMLTFTTQKGGKKTHQFVESLRVSRGVITGMAGHDTPLWAEVGAATAAMGTAAVAAMAFSHRKRMRAYSKL